jgi:hypothetical protein
LKWKARLIALDVIKANSGAKFAPLDDQLELSVDDSEMSLELERADDAAIVAMALAKLEPRQREALIASLYEEKATSEVASQLGLNENATRQLVFRAKSAFKKALVGEAETRGLSVSEILSVAARKASKDAGKYISAASALLLVLAVSIGIFPNLGNNNQQLIAEGPSATESQAVPVPGSTDENVVPSDDSLAIDVAVDEVSQTTVGPETTFAAEVDASGEVEDFVVPASGGQSIGTAQLESVGMTPRASFVDYSPFDPWLLDPLVEAELIKTTLLSGDVSVTSATPTLLTMVSDKGIWADVHFQLGTKEAFQNVRVGLWVDGEQFFASTSATDLLVLASDATSESYSFVGSIGELRDLKGTSYSNTRLDGAIVRIVLTVDLAAGKITKSGIGISQPSMP